MQHRNVTGGTSQQPLNREMVKFLDCTFVYCVGEVVFIVFLPVTVFQAPTLHFTWLFCHQTSPVHVVIMSLKGRQFRCRFSCSCPSPCRSGNSLCQCATAAVDLFCKWLKVPSSYGFIFQCIEVIGETVVHNTSASSVALFSASTLCAL